MISKRFKNILVGSLSLAAGGLLYICFRENTYISKLAELFLPLHSVRALLRPFRNEFLLYHFADLLWGVSLGCFLNAIHQSAGKAIWCAVSVAVYGCLWELLQQLHIVSGTADPLDILMYLAASILTIIINMEGKENEA